MTRLALAAVLVLTALAFLLPSVQSSNQSQMEERIAVLESRVATLEANAIPIHRIPVYEGAGDPNLITTSYEQDDIVPMDPEATLDLVCTIKPTHLDRAGIQPGLSTLQCSRYQRIAPFYFGD